MSRKPQIGICLMVAVAGWMAAPPALGQDRFVSLFDGRTLSGWDGNPKLWSVRDGMIVGSTMKNRTRGNTFLIWKGGEPENFELRVTARVKGNNSGIQYRSRVVDAKNWVVGGYQADQHPSQNYIGMMYEEKGRGILAQRGQKVVIDSNGKKKVVGSFDKSTRIDISQFHEYTILARGNHLTHKIDGKITVVIIDNQVSKRRMKGILALQLHAGGSMEVSVKSVRIKMLTGEAAKSPADDGAGQEAASAKAAAAGKGAQHDGKAPRPNWIWLGAGRDGERLRLRKTFTLPGGVKSASLLFTCDNFCTAFINGKEIGGTREWNQPALADVTRLLRAGTNVIAVDAGNQGGVAAFAARLEITRAAGKREYVLSDGTWRVSRGKDKDWTAAGFSDARWQRPTIVGRMGVAPWGDVFARGKAGRPRRGKPVSATANYSPKVLDGFKLEKIYHVPKQTQGSWVSMTIDPKGRLYCCDQNGSIWRVTLTGPGGTVKSVDRVPVGVGRAHGLLHAFGKLYIMSHRPPGLHVASDTNGDGTFDKVEKLRDISGGGEHGPHAVVLAPDGKTLYVIAGNHTELPRNMEGSLVPRVWKEDHLIPRMWDARGHARGKLAPGGHISRTDAKGKRFELVAMGFRNPYDMAFNLDGELFAYDADMEWDVGAPWYRPTRVNHIVSGAEFGWRSGTGKYPTYYADSLPAIVDIGPGSPTGVVSGNGAKFPAKYQRAIYTLDWTFGTMNAIHFKPQGASYVAEKEEFVTGKPLPLTDAAISPVDGAMYFAVGGRGGQSAVYRVTYIGNESTARVRSGNPEGEALRALRRRLERFHAKRDARAVSEAWAYLKHEDRHIRYAARVAIEHQPVGSWQNRALAERDPVSAIHALLALTRHGDKSLQPRILGALARIEWTALNEYHQLALLRTYALTFTRMGRAGPKHLSAVRNRFDRMFPAASDALNRELSRLLVYVDSPTIVSKALPLMAQKTDRPPVTDMQLIARNNRYGGTIANMAANQPELQQIEYAFALRVAKAGWTPKLRGEYFKWFNDAGAFRGGASFGGFLRNIKNEALKNVPADQRQRLQKIAGSMSAAGPKILPRAKGPGKNWTVAQLTRLTAGGLRGRDFKNGHKMYAAAMCASCHLFAGGGALGGPDLTNLAGRFTYRSLIESIVEPSKVISDQYQNTVYTNIDGTQVIGRVVDEKNGALLIMVSPLVPDALVSLPKNRIRSKAPSKVSPMMPSLLSSLNEDEVLDLLAYLLSRGNPDAKEFK